MGHDEDKNFGGGTAPVNPVTVTPNPRANIAKNRIGMRPARNFSTETAQEELNRISGVASQTQTTGGDIVLNNVSVKKSNKIIILFVVGVILMVVIAVVLLLTNNKIIGYDGTRASFNRFANQLLYGKDSDEDIKEEKYQLGNTYYLNELMAKTGYERGTEAPEELKTYFTKVRTNYSVFYAEVEKNDKKDEYAELLDGYSDNLAELEYSYITPVLTVEALQLVFANNKDTAKIVTSRYYSAMTNDSDDNVKKKGYEYINQTTKLLDIIKKYDENGCYDQSGIMKNVCNPSFARDNADEVGQNYILLKDFFNKEKTRINLSETNTFLNVWNIRGAVYENK